MLIMEIKMKLRDLEYIVAIDQHKNFAKAADLCNVSQSTLSIQVKKVEEYLGVQIFERTNKKVMTTKIGQDICVSGKKIILESQRIKQISKAHIDPYARDLLLGTIPTLAPYLIPQLIAPMKQEMPNLKVYFTEEKAGRLESKLENGEVDCALLGLPTDIPNFICEELFWEPYYLAVPANHPLSTKKEIETGEIAKEPLLLLEEDHCLTAHVLGELCDIIGIEGTSPFQATSIETLKNMVAMGTGITIVPGTAIDWRDTIKYIPFKSKEIGHMIGLAWRETSSQEELYKDIAKLIKTHIRSDEK